MKPAPLPRGVYRTKAGRFAARCQVDRQVIALGTYATVAEAAEAVRCKEEQLGRYAARQGRTTPG